MRRAAVLGHPIAHSLSPVLHTAAYAALGLTDWEYTSADVDSPQLGDFVASCGPEWAGLSLTMPLKHTILEMLDHIEPLAEVVGAVNTVLFQHGSGRPTLIGANTDVYGIVAALREGLAEQAAQASATRSSGTQPSTTQPPASGRVVVLGAGATASSTLAALGELGYHTPVVFVRSLARTGALRRAASSMGVEPTFHTLDRAADAVVGADMVISTLPSGAADSIADGLESVGHGVLLDVSYDRRPTPLGAAWVAAGGVNVGGERMLLHQAGEQVRLMTGRSAPIDAMSAALEESLKNA